jgi:hypothetical protein
LVAAIELISQGNKDRPESRRAVVGKVAALLQRNVRVSLVDAVTIRDFNFYTEVLEFIGGNDPALRSKPPCLYAATVRPEQADRRPHRNSLGECSTLPQSIATSSARRVQPSRLLSGLFCMNPCRLRTRDILKPLERRSLRLRRG